MTAITKSTVTKLANGTIKNVSAKTSMKMAFSRCWNGALTSGFAVGSYLSDGADYLRNVIENKTTE